MTKEQARLIVDMHEIDRTLADAEEADLLALHNPELLVAYKALLKLAELPY